MWDRLCYQLVTFNTDCEATFESYVFVKNHLCCKIFIIMRLQQQDLSAEIHNYFEENKGQDLNDLPPSVHFHCSAFVFDYLKNTSCSLSLLLSPFFYTIFFWFYNNANRFVCLQLKYYVCKSENLLLVFRCMDIASKWLNTQLNRQK